MRRGRPASGRTTLAFVDVLRDQRLAPAERRFSLPFVPVAGVVAGARTKHSQEAGETADAQVALEYLQYVRAELLAGQFS